MSKWMNIWIFLLFSTSSFRQMKELERSRRITMKSTTMSKPELLPMLWWKGSLPRRHGNGKLVTGVCFHWLPYQDLVGGVSWPRRLRRQRDVMEWCYSSISPAEKQPNRRREATILWTDQQPSAGVALAFDRYPRPKVTELAHFAF